MTRLLAGYLAIYGEDVAKLHRAAEDLLASKRAEDADVAALLEWAKGQPRPWLAEQLGYDPSNLAKVLAGRIRPKSVIAKLHELREQLRLD